MKHLTKKTLVWYIGATWQIRLKLCALAPPGEYDSTRATFGLPESTIQMANRSIQQLLHSSQQKVYILYNG